MQSYRNSQVKASDREMFISGAKFGAEWQSTSLTTALKESDDEIKRLREALEDLIMVSKDGLFKNFDNEYSFNLLDKAIKSATTALTTQNGKD